MSNYERILWCFYGCFWVVFGWFLGGFLVVFEWFFGGFWVVFEEVLKFFLVFKRFL